MPEKYNFDKAYNEALEGNDNVIKLKGEVSTEKEPNRNDYGKTEKFLKIDINKQQDVDNKKLEEVRQKLHKNFNEKSKEKESRPEKLYRGYAVHPDELSIEKLQETLIPMNVNENDPTKVSDGNELGVYMSTNENMVKMYGQNNAFIKDLQIETPVYNSGYGKINYIGLPSCGVIIEIDTKNLSIKKPEITSCLQGVYNNGMSGDEWIADKISATNYRVKKLILNIRQSDSTRLILDVDGSDEKELQKAIDFIKNESKKNKQEAIEYKKFLETLSDNERIRNKLYLESRWEEYQNKKFNNP